MLALSCSSYRNLNDATLWQVPVPRRNCADGVSHKVETSHLANEQIFHLNRPISAKVLLSTDTIIMGVINLKMQILKSTTIQWPFIQDSVGQPTPEKQPSTNTMVGGYYTTQIVTNS